MSTTRRDVSSEIESPIGLTDLGRVRVLRALATHRQLMRAELISLTGLARATVSSILYELTSADLVRESVAADTTGTRTGRPPQVLSLVPEAAHAIGLDIAHDHVRAVLVDLVGTVLWDHTHPMAVDSEPERALDTAVRLIDAALRDVDLPREKVLGLGAGFACPVDRDHRRLYAEGIMPGWVGMQPLEELAGRTGLTVRIVNDANAGMLAERRFGAAQDCDNALYLRLSSGIGAGALCDGRLLLGHEGIAGELGHVVIQPEGLVCRCGNRGCLETIASPGAIADLLTRSWGRPVAPADLADLMRAADRGTVRAIEDAGAAVGRVLAGAVMLLNPKVIVVGGELAQAGETLFGPMRRMIAQYSMAAHAASLRIVPSALGDSAGVRGAAALMLEAAPEALVRSLAGVGTRAG